MLEIKFKQLLSRYGNLRKNYIQNYANLGGWVSKCIRENYFLLLKCYKM